MEEESIESSWDRSGSTVVEPELGVEEFPDNRLVGVLYGFQHTLVDPNPFIYPLIVGAAAGWGDATTLDAIQMTLLFVMVATIAQTTVGNRLPLIQNASIAETGIMAGIAASVGTPAMWMGAFLGGVFEAVVGASRALRYLRFAITPVVSGAIIAVIGISLAKIGMGWILNAGDGTMTLNARVAFATGTILLFVTLKMVGRRWSAVVSRASLVIAFVTMGFLVPAVTDALGVTRALDTSPVAATPWFGVPSVPYSGTPLLDWPVVAGAVAAMALGYLSSMMESVGDYAATCAVSDVDFDDDTVNRGLTVEGVSSATSVLFGGLPMTSYSQNIGIIATTRVASRRVVMVAGLLFGVYGLVPKLGRLFTTVPQAVLGGVFIVLTGMIAIAGIWTIAQAARSDGNLLIGALTVVVPLTLPDVVSGATWLDALPPGVEVLVTSHIVVAVITGIVTSLLVGELLEPYVPDAPLPRDAEP